MPGNRKKVAFKLRHLPYYILIEFELILHTLSYARDWFTRKYSKNKKQEPYHLL